jgi:hypothetical protein
MDVSDKWDGLVRARTIQEFGLPNASFSLAWVAALSLHKGFSDLSCLCVLFFRLGQRAIQGKGYTASFVLIKTEGFSPSCQLTRDEPKLSGDFQNPRPGDPFFCGLSKVNLTRQLPNLLAKLVYSHKNEGL